LADFELLEELVAGVLFTEAFVGCRGVAAMDCVRLFFGKVVFGRFCKVGRMGVG